MNQENKILNPTPIKLMRFSLSSSKFTCKNTYEAIFFQKEFQIFLNMRANSQNPHEKDEFFKCQSQESLGEQNEADWKKFEEELCDSCATTEEN